MTHRFFASELEGVATYWTIRRRDGVTLGFTSHNRGLAFGNVTCRAAPGMVPSAIRRTASLERDTVEVEGVLSHDSISSADLEAGRFAGAQITIGLVDWETLDHAGLFHGELAAVAQEDGEFQAELRSAKARLEADVVPRTSPTCRAAFCDDQCQLNPARFTHLCSVSAIDVEANSVAFTNAPDAGAMAHGHVRWIDGPFAGLALQVIDSIGNALVFDRPVSDALSLGTKAFLREGCDHTLATCAGRFANAINFRGEPHLPGNDLLTSYPSTR